MPEARGITYEIKVDRVVGPARATGDGGVIVVLAAGSARLRLRLAPRDAARLATGLAAAARRERRGEERTTPTARPS